MRRLAILIGVISALLSGSFAHAQESGVSRHPMEALSPDEVARAVELLKAAGLADGNTLFPQIALFEMPKAAVLAWTPGAP
ncbi:MAG: hypothetical protein HC855_10530 [Rhizobiales bacterium]|nr:hypothetical protein [Hyphomicrobiales bacterium]